MAISLKKGEKISLSKVDASLKSVYIGLGWDMQRKKLGIFNSRKSQIDCDASVILLDEMNKLQNKNDVVYFNNLRHISNSVMHEGDNLTGEGEGDDEVIKIFLDDVPSEITKLLFVANIYKSIERSQHFGMVQNAYIRLVNMDTKEELIRFNLTDDYNGFTALKIAEVYRDANDWQFSALGEGINATSLGEICKKY